MAKTIDTLERALGIALARLRETGATKLAAQLEELAAGGSPWKTLEKQADGTYDFALDGARVVNPLMSASGREYDPADTSPDAFTPARYGFAIVDTGGGCTAWAQTFLDESGRLVDMLITDDASHKCEGCRAEFGVYFEGSPIAQWSRDRLGQPENIET